MLKVGMLFLFVLVSFQSFAGEFTHLKLSPQFEQYLTGPKNERSSSSGHSLKSAKALVDDDEVGAVVAQRFRSAVFGGSSDASSSLLKSDWNSPFPADGEESPLYEEIRRHLEASHQEIGRTHVGQLDLINRQFNLGTQNFSGFSWQRPFGVIQVYADRQVTPNLFGDNWLVQDTFVFDVEAASFLEKLNDAGLLEMSAAEIGAFAGITFKRVYTYYHYAGSYQEGLSASFTKLFLPFAYFNRPGVERMGHEEIMKREDHWSARVGGMISTPPYYGVSASAGVLAEVAFERTTTVQSTHTEDAENERYRISVNAKKSAQAGVNVSLQLDFFKLIKFSLLNFDLNYEYAKGQEYGLAFTPPQWSEVKQDPVRDREVRTILRGFGSVNSLEPYVVRLDESSSSTFQVRGSVLLWGRLKKSKTEQIRVIKDGQVRVFYKNYATSIKVVQNFFSRIFSAVIYKLLQLPIGTSNAAMFSRQVNLEYEASHAQAGNPEVSRVEDTSKFSFVITQSYDAAKTHRWIDGRFKKDVIWFVDKFTTLPKDYKTIIRSEQLRGPLRVESNLRVEKAGLDHLLTSNENDVWGKIARVCGSGKLSEWMDERTRARKLSKLQIGKEACVKRIGNKFMAFKQDFVVNSFMPSIKKFKKFLTDFYKNSEDLETLSDLFGHKNTFINGRIQATTSEGHDFVTTFSAGQFRGLGVIDNFKRAGGSRMPATIVSE